MDEGMELPSTEPGFQSGAVAPTGVDDFAGLQRQIGERGVAVKKPNVVKILGRFAPRLVEQSGVLWRKAQAELFV